MNKNQEIGRRVKQLRQSQELSQGRLSTISKVPQPTISRIELGKHTETTDAVLSKLSRSLGVTVHFLRYGDSGGEHENVVQIDKTPSQKRIPVISWVHAGGWTEAIDLHQPGFADDWIIPPAKKKMSERTYALVVQGDSMSNPGDPHFHFPPGCHIIVDPEQRTPTSGQLVIARLSGTDTVTFKRYKVEDGRPYLHPLNPDFKPIFDEFVILGRVIGKHVYHEY